MRNILNFDLNLLRVFAAVFHEGSVTKAADRLNITQSAVSHGLAKLRDSFDDKLFVRGPDGMRATPRAEELAQAFLPGLNQIDDALSEEEFDPSSAKTEFVIAVSDYLASTFFPAILQRIQAEHPGIRFWLRPPTDLHIAEELDRGNLHLTLGGFWDIPDRLLGEHVISDPNVWMMRKDHPAARSAKLHLRDLAEHPHLDILISRRGELTTRGTVHQGGLERAYVTSNPRHLEGLLAAEGLSRRVGLTMSHILAIPPMIASTDMLVFVPRHFAEVGAASHGLVYRTPPYKMPPFEATMVTHRILGAHPSVVWLRSYVKSAIMAAMEVRKQAKKSPST